MKYLAQISVSYFIIAHTIFELIDISNSVPLCIFYFSSMYISFILYCINNWLRDKLLFDLMIALAFFIRLLWENAKWGLSFEEYMISVNSYEKSVLIAIFTITLLTSTIHHARKTRNNIKSN